jgi:hypothetical protein
VLLRYLREVDYFEKELSLREKEVESRFLNSTIARKTIETVNQIRNHIIRGYGHVALSLDRKEYFRCRPLYSATGDLHEFLGALDIRRDQLNTDNPIVHQRFDREDLIELQPGPLMNQIHSYIEALPEEKRILRNPRGEYNRVFLEILFGFIEVMDFLLNDERSRLKEAGAEVLYASAEERRIYKEIEEDQTPLRVDLKKDFEEVDRLTGLFSKNEYLRVMPTLFQNSRQAGGALSGSKEIPLLMAQKEPAEKKKADPSYPGGLEDFLERWKDKEPGTLSIEVDSDFVPYLGKYLQDS